MPDLCCAYTFAGMTLNPSSGDGLFVGESGIVGLDGKPIRSTIDPKGVTDGSWVHPKFFDGRVIMFTGPVRINSVPKKPTAAYFAALNAVEDAWIAALEAKLNTPDTLAWTPHGGSARSLTCTYGVEGGHIEFTGSMMDPRFHFTLVAENPAIS